VVGLTGVAIVLLVAIFAPLISPHDPIKQNLANALKPPAWAEGGTDEYPLGTDALGRDVASRLAYGTRYSIVISTTAVLISALLGLILGLVSGYSRGSVDAVIMRLGDVQLAFPFVLLAIAILGTTADRSPLLLILVLGVPAWIFYARLVRSRVLAELGKDYITAARAVGAEGPRMVLGYVLPNVWQLVPQVAMLDVAYKIVVESMLTFLGLGIAPPTPSWGSILADGKNLMIIAPWLVVLPILAIFFTVLSINLAADGIADLLDPKIARGGFRRIRLRSPSPQGEEDDDTPPLLRVQDLKVEFPSEDRVVYAVRGISFDLEQGQALGIVGESGSGKTVTALSIIQLLDSPGRITSGQILFHGQDLTRISDTEMAYLRGGRIGMIFQNPAASLNPVRKIGSQMAEALQRHRGLSQAKVSAQARETLLSVGIGNPEQILQAYPFELSGGMNQRVMIGMSMEVQPDLLIADEPTSALDVTTAAQILERLKEMQRRHNTSVILITHDIALVAEFADTILVMYAGQVCEFGPIRTVIDTPKHPYTEALLISVPRADLPAGTRLTAIAGELPDPAVVPLGCPFAPRCRSVMDVCRKVTPLFTTVGQKHKAACHLNSPDAKNAWES
jgi:peptide/nickel transport system permease protein